MNDIAPALAKTAPPFVVLALTLNQWALVAAITYTVLQIAYLIWKWRREYSAK